MTTGRRLLTLIIVLSLIGIPAVVLSVACIGDACTGPAVAKAAVPFCPLPKDLRTLIENGYYKGRSPDVFGVPRDPGLDGSTGALRPGGAIPSWPTTGSVAATRVPILLWGDGVRSGPLPPGTGLDQIAPTLAKIVGLHRPNPDVRSGVAIDGVAKRARPRLILLVGLKGAHFSALPQANVPGWPALDTMAKKGAFTTDGTTGSLPLDSAAELATMGIGALPSEHGMTGSLVRNNGGKLVQAWGPGSPIPVLASLGDDLDHELAGKPIVGMVGTAPADRGLIGGNWYLGGGQDTFRLAPASGVATATAQLLGAGYGADATPDLLGVTLDASRPGQADAQLAAIVKAAEQVSGGALTVAVAGIPAPAPEPRTSGVGVDYVVRTLEQRLHAPGVVQAAIPGGLFLNQSILAEKALPQGKVVQALKSIDIPGKRAPLMLDAYPGFSISFARYC